jgi:hypothetical protein
MNLVHGCPVPLQNDLSIVKLLLDHDYDPVEEAKKEKEEEASKKASLVREHSRRLFTLGQGNLLGAAATTAPAALTNGDVAASGDKEPAAMEVDGEEKQDNKKDKEEKKKEEETEDNIDPDGECTDK